MQEILKAIPDYEGLYEVSNLGYVRSIDRVVYNSRGHYVKRKGVILKPSTVRYPIVILCKNGTIKYKTLARIVATAFIPNPDNLPEVNHINKDKLNCSVSNLEWTTRRENQVHRNIGNTKLTSKYPGVYMHAREGRWVAQASINGKQKWLGYFDSELAAFKKYCSVLEENGVVNRYAVL